MEETGATRKRIGWRCGAREGRGRLGELSQQRVWSCSGRQIKASLRLRERDKAEQAAAEGAADPGCCCIFRLLAISGPQTSNTRHPQLAWGPPSLADAYVVRPPSARSLSSLHRINRITPVMLVTKPQFHFIRRRPAFPVFHLFFEGLQAVWCSPLSLCCVMFLTLIRTPFWLYSRCLCILT